MKKIMLVLGSIFFGLGAMLWFWVAYTQSDPQLAQVAWKISLTPICASILLAMLARNYHKPNRE